VSHPEGGLEKKRKEITVRRLKAINKDDLEFEIKAAFEGFSLINNIDQLAGYYDSALTTVVNKVEIIKCITIRPTVPWFKMESLQLKQAMRKAKRVWRKHLKRIIWRNSKLPKLLT
jgi:hypothetical protein